MLAAAMTVLAQGTALSAEPMGITQPVQMTKDDLNPGRLYQAPALAIDPSNPKRVAAGFNELRTKSCGFMRSSDGGQTWTKPEAQPAPESFPFCTTNNRGAFQGQIAFGRNGTIYYAFPGWDESDAGTRGNSSIIVAKSTDFGDSWETVIARNNRGKQGEEQEFQRPIGSLAVDTRSGSQDIVYVGFTTRLTGFSNPNAAPAISTVMVSTDAGATWAEPVHLPVTIFSDESVRTRGLTARTTIPGASTPPNTAPAGSRAAEPNQAVNFGGFQPVVTVADDGTAYAIWPSNTANINPGPPVGLFLSKSTDRGATWTTSQAQPFSYANNTFAHLAWTPGGGPAGTLHGVWEYRERPEVLGAHDVYYIRSTDGGETWETPRNLTDDRPEDYHGQYYPNLKVAPNGRIDVAFYDTRFDPGIRSNDIMYTYSEDNGQTWSANQRITDRSVDRRIGVWAINYDMTTPPSLASANEHAIIGWDDTRHTDVSVGDNTNLGGGLQDIYVANVQFAALGGGMSKAAKAIIAGVVGLVAVGLVLLLVSFLARGQSGPSPRARSKAKASTKAPAEVS
jgi:hypothetical protein